MLVPTQRSWRRRPASPASRRRTPRPSSMPVFGNFVHAVYRGEKVELRGFGSFRLRRGEPHRGRNPRTGDRVDVPSKRVAYFKPGKELKELINREPAPVGPAASSSPASMSDAGTPLSWPEGRPGRSAGRHDQRVRSANIGEETCVRDGHLRDSRHRDRLRHAVGAWRGAQNRELLLGQHIEIGLHVPGPSPGSQRDATVAPGDIATVKADERPMRIRRSESTASRRACRNDPAAGTTDARRVTPPPWPPAATPNTSASGQQPLGAVPPSSCASAWRQP